jgi:hypothetical protein
MKFNQRYRIAISVVVLAIMAGVLVGINGTPVGVGAVTTACGCGFSKEITKNGNKVKECNFRVEEKPCQIEFKFVGGGEGWRAEKREEKGGEWGKRYNLNPGCKLKQLYKGGESCKDEITVNEKLNNSENEYCLLFETESGALKGIGGCTTLKE